MLLGSVMKQLQWVSTMTISERHIFTLTIQF